MDNNAYSRAGAGFPVTSNTTVSGTATNTAAAQRVIPLLQAINRVEELTGSLAMRLDPVTNHVPQEPKTSNPPTTVTGRLNSLGDTLQYLLDNIEL